ncbi:MAG TPA: trigger factor [Candidatus Saccharimonadales bacterium]|nr:trigger factor [Candidatus Saccharimonadales bacterium]
MQTNRKNLSDTKVELTISADSELLNSAKSQAVQRLRSDVKVAGFRSGKVPAAVAEKHINPNALQSAVLDIAINEMYSQAVASESLRPITQPEITLKKFVPYTDIEIVAVIEVLGKITVPDYKKLKLAKKPVSITAKDVDDVLEALRVRASEKIKVERAAKDGDELLIDFAGTDAKSGDKIQGADGKEYPLLLGSNTFIPGFEQNLIGLKPGESKTFYLTFPKDYGVSALQNRKVTFKVTVLNVKELQKPKLDDAFAAKAGPFKKLDDLKADIKKQVTAERENESERTFENELIEKIVAGSKITVPESLVDEEIERLEIDEKRNLTYRGQTWEEHLKQEGVTEAEHKEQKRPQAILRIKGALALSEIANLEDIKVTPEELEIRLQLLKGQYQDPQMQAELDKPENQQDILNRMVTEKTINKLKNYATS